IIFLNNVIVVESTKKSLESHRSFFGILLSEKKRQYCGYILEKVFSNNSGQRRILASLKVLLRGIQPMPKCFKLRLCAAKPEHSSRIPPISSITVNNMHTR